MVVCGPDDWFLLECKVLSSFEKKILAEISGERAYKYVAQMVEPVNRTAGTDAELEGASKVKELFAPLVDKCELEGVPVTAYPRREGYLEVISPLKLSIPCEAAPLSGSGSGEATLIDLGDGTKHDYQRLGVSVKNAAVLATTSRPAVEATLEKRIAAALEAKNRGAKCYIFSIPGAIEELVPIFGLSADFPALIISTRSAAELRELLSQHQEVRVKFRSLVESASAITYNVVGTITGSKYPDEVIYLTSHHDTWYYGANDNGATTACLLEVARTFAEHRPRHTIKFVIFGAEESGGKTGDALPFALEGSYGYTEAHRAELERISTGQHTLCDVNGEILGCTPRTMAMCSPEMLLFTLKVASDLGGYARAVEPPTLWFWSDHLNFHTLGIPAISIGPASDLGTNERSHFFKIYHTTRDNMDAINPQALAINSNLMALLAHRIDSAEIPPYSLEMLESIGTRNLEVLPNMERLANLLRRKVEYCYQAKDREERMNRVLKLISVVNRNTYGFIVHTLPVHKFEYMADVTGKLMDARNIVELEGDFDRAHAVLRTIKGAALYDDFAPDVLAEIDRMENLSGITSRFGRCAVGLEDIFRALDKNEPPEGILYRIDAVRQRVTKMLNAWATQYEQALQEV